MEEVMKLADAAYRANKVAPSSSRSSGPVIMLLYKEKRWDPKMIIGSGGMPSSHSSTVVAHLQYLLVYTWELIHHRLQLLLSWLLLNCYVVYCAINYIVDIQSRVYAFKMFSSAWYKGKQHYNGSRTEGK